MFNYAKRGLKEGCWTKCVSASGVRAADKSPEVLGIVSNLGWAVPR